MRRLKTEAPISARPARTRDDQMRQHRDAKTSSAAACGANSAGTWVLSEKSRISGSTSLAPMSLVARPSPSCVPGSKSTPR